MFRRLTPLFVVALLVGAGFLLHQELRAYHYDDIRRSLAAIPNRKVATALALTALSYWILTGYDVLALRYIGRPLPYLRTALASFLGYAFAHNFGFSVLSGAAPRFRLYSAWGLTPAEIALLVAFTAATFWLGIFAVVGTALVADPFGLRDAIHLPGRLGYAIAGILLGLVFAYLAAATFWRHPLAVRGWTIALPRAPIACAQVFIGVADWVIAAAVLYGLLPTGSAVSFAHFVAVFSAAQVAGVSSHVPGGLGVFDTIIVLALAQHAPTPAVLGALIVYRATYYLLPLAVGTALLAAYEMRARRAQLVQTGAIVGRWLSEIAPHVLAVALFASGTLLLLSGSTPRHTSRLDLLADLLPLPVLEASHFLASLAGLGLILLASGLQRRLDAAYHLAIALLATGAVLSLLKGFDYEESALLVGMLAALLPCRAEFYRRASLISERFTLGWTVAVSAVLIASLGLGFFAHGHTEYAHDLWWQFSFFDDAPRFLRASVGVAVAVLAIAGWHLLRPARLRATAPDADSLAAVRTVIAASPVAAVHLALLGDKSFLFSDDRRAFIMYASSGRCCVAMGDPVGPEASAAELVWQFRELCDRHGMWPVFYEATTTALPLYVDAGLTPLKFGEEARVALAMFTLQGGVHRPQRYVLNAVEREGASFEVRPATDLPSLLPELAMISDAWLSEKHTREKGFSLGYFDAQYLAQFPVALVRCDGAIVAFANLWCSADRTEVSPDLMRYRHGAPTSVMEYLFLRIILWAQAEGYQWFSLGMAPLAGLEARWAAPLWNRLGAFAFRYGEHFYNFQGLRQFKNKFDPEWQPKYLVYPGGIILPRVLTNVATLVSGGLRGVVAK